MYRLLFVFIALLFCNAALVQADEVDDYVRLQMQKRSIPALQLAVVHKGKIIKSQNYGVSNIELNAPVTDDTMFEIASNTKQFTAGAIMLLAQDGKLNLDDSITKYLSGLPPTYNAITVRYLLNHTSGVKDYIEEFELNRRLDYTNQELIERIGANELNFPPGENARYSTTGYLLLGLIIEQITGKPYGEFLRERIFEPLGMNRTRAINLAEIIPNRASGYKFENGILRNGRYVAQTLRASADIGLMTTALDTAKWDAALNTNKIFTRVSLDAMFTPARLKNGSIAYNDWNANFGLGWFIDDYFGHRNINHGGTFITGFHAEISRYVDEKLTVIILTNRVQSYPYTIGMSIAGMFNPALRIPHQLEPQPDVNLQRSQKLKQFLSSVASGAIDSAQMTEGFRARFSYDALDYTTSKSEIPAIMKDLKSFSFVACKNVETRKVERIGTQIKNLCSYKIVTRQKTHFFTFYLTAQDKIADIWIYSHPE
jgi:CubicO group peptidase (beta-lactamase class C family)